MAEIELPPPARAYAALRFPDPPAGRPFVYLNMVASADGKAIAGVDEAPLSSATDRLALQSLRVHADAILNGAGTVRATGASPLLRNAELRAIRRAGGRPHPPLQVVLSRRGTLDPNLALLQRRDFNAVIFVTELAEAAQIERVRDTGRGVEILPATNTIPELLSRLRESYEVRQLLLEGGPTLNAAFFHAGLVDEFFLTVSPHIAAGRDTITPVEGDPFAPSELPQLELRSAIPVADTGEVYLHWRVQHAGTER